MAKIIILLSFQNILKTPEKFYSRI